MQKFLMFLFYLIFILGVCLPAFGLEIKGLVTDSRTEEPLVGVNVYIEGTNAGTATDEDGYFSISYEISDPFKLVFSFVGYKSVTLDLSPSDDLSMLKVSMIEDIFQSEAIVVTGIASRTSKDIAEVAVSRVSAVDYTDVTAYQDISKLVTGKIAGVQLKPASGNVGGGFRFYMRSGGGLNGNEQPVIYIDGVRIDNTEIEGFGAGGQGISTLADINPEDIENMEVLKGSAAAATYGTNGSNGVVLITTKSGKMTSAEKGGISLSYKGLTGLNTQSYKYSKDDFMSAKNANKIFRDGDITQHTLNAAGGNNFIRYYASFDERNEEGIIHNNQMDRKTVRANVNVFPSEKVSFKFGGGYTLNEISRPNNDNNILGYLGNTLLVPFGTWTYYFTDSLAVEGIQDIHKINRFIGNAQVTYTPIKNLEALFRVGIDHSDYRQDRLYPSNLDYSGVGITEGDKQIWLRENRQYTYDLNVRYNYNILSDLNATTVLGTQIFNRKWSTSFMEAQGFSSPLVTDIGAAYEFLDKGEGFENSKDAGLFIEHSMSFKNQYFMTLGLRQDYATSIGAEAANVFYPKASLAVRMDKYGWFPKMLNLFKVRAAYGESGQLPGIVDGIALVWENETGGYGGGAVYSSIGNEDIEPERIKEFEVGFETEFQNNYSLEFTYYKQMAENSIIDRRLAPSTGLTASGLPYNVGAIDGWGIETLLQATPIKTKNYQLDVSLVNNYQTNEVTDLGGAQPIYDGFDVNVIKEGLPKHEFYTYKVYGALFEDDGSYAGPDVSEDKVSFGNPVPDYTGSLMISFRFLKNFNFYVLSDWATGLKVFNSTRSFAIQFYNDTEVTKLEAQLYGGDDEIEQLTPGTQAYRDAANRYAKLDYNYDGNFIEDADYLKIREISLSYSLKDLLPFVKMDPYIKDLVLGFSAHNIFTETKYSGADPEVDFDGSRSLTRGQDFLTLQSPRVYNFFLRVGL